RYRTLFESASYSMLLLNNQGKIELANLACEAMFGYKKEELINKIIEVLIPEKYVHDHHENIKKFLSIPEKQNIDNIIQTFGQTKNGHMFPIEIRLAPAEFFDGKYVIASIIDVSHYIKTDNKAK
ncbi:MAG: PAS domain S-box protein, partial [Calditrichaceae bacterium]